MTSQKNNRPGIDILKKERLWDGFIRLDRVTASIPGTEGNRIEITREVHDHGNAATILPVDKSRKKALLVSQWRIPAWLNGFEERLWEAPAGIVEQGELPENCAMRETLEETGYQVTNLRLICNTFSSPGLVTERVHIYLADYDETSRVTDQIGVASEGEDIYLREFGFEELFSMLDSRQLFDATTIIAVYALRAEINK